MNQFPVFVFLVLSSSCISQNKTGLKLWYAQPSGTTWENALRTGNGRLGAMVYGNPDAETIGLNEHTLWSGGPNRNDNSLALDSLPALRKLIFRHKDKTITADISSTPGDFTGKAIASLITSNKFNDPFTFDQQAHYLPVTKEIAIGSNKLSYAFPRIHLHRSK